MGVERFLNEQIRLPTAPAIAARIIKAVRDENDSYHSLAAVIAADPALAAKLLAVANSSLYSPPHEVVRIEQAITILGLNSVKNIALSFSVVRSLGRPSANGFDFSRFLKRSVTGAVAAEMIGNRIGRLSMDFFSSALLQDVGMLVFALVAPEEYGQVMDEVTTSHQHLCVLEKQRFGCDHQELGAEVLRYWGLPDSLWLPILHHHRLSQPEEQYCVAADLLYLADRVGSLYHGFHSAERVREIKDLLLERYELSEDTSDELIDAIAKRASEMLTIYDIDSASIKPYSQLLQEANDELGRLNLSYEQLVMELKQSQEKSDQLAAELKDANGKLRELVSRDGLTGLYNHRHFQEMLLKEVHVAARYQRSLTLILFDVDHFKNVNDNFGHPAGDAVLKSIARLVADMVRASDVVARYGGEEFAVILPETRSREAVILAERIRRGIEGMEVVVGEVVIRVTVSLGICTYLGKGTSDAKGVLIESADQALYAAKRNGRNRLMVAR